MKKNTKKKKKNKHFHLLILIIIILGSLFLYKYTENHLAVKKLFNKIENLEGYITKYTIYGTHLNIEGKINLTDIDNIDLILFKNNKEQTFKLDYKVKDNTTFKLSDNINDGIDLEKLKIGEYIALLKINNKYYPLYNTTDYENTDYCTLTKNNHNNQIEISFKNKYKKQYLSINVSIPERAIMMT